VQKSLTRRGILPLGEVGSIRRSAREIAFPAIFSALAVVAAVLFRFGGAVVPFSVLPFVAILSGLVLGSRRGALAMAAYVLLGLVGLPVFAAPPYGGVAYVLKPSFGFLPGFVAAAYAAGRVEELQRTAAPSSGASLSRGLAAVLAGLVALYVPGIAYLWLVSRVYLGEALGAAGALRMAFFPFILPDLAKAGVAALLAGPIRRRLAAASLGPEEDPG